MGMDFRDRQGQAELCDICDFIDVVGSIALNARQPSPHTLAAVGSNAPPPPARPVGKTSESSALPGKSEDAVGIAATPPREPPDASAPSSANAAGEESANKTKICSSEGVEAAAQPAASQDNKDAQSCDAPGSTEAVANCEVATLQQLLQSKLCNVALVSDVDEQLLLNISFKQPVRLTSFSVLASTPPAGFSTVPEEEDSVSGPMLVKVYCNKNTLNFCGVADEACAFSVMLSADDVLNERRIALPGSKFQMCSSVQIFIQENLSDSALTFINKLALFGVAHKRYS
ncbi:hypothetical protein Efla_000896 [Eimeria flavescens]